MTFRSTQHQTKEEKPDDRKERKVADSIASALCNIIATQGKIQDLRESLRNQQEYLKGIEAQEQVKVGDIVG